MVLQVGADAGRVLHNRDAVALQERARPDPAELQDVRRADRAGGQDHLGRGARFDDAAVQAETHAARAALIQQDALDLRAGHNPQIGTLDDRP